MRQTNSTKLTDRSV